MSFRSNLHPGTFMTSHFVRSAPDLRILIVDDDPDEFPLLEAGFALHRCPVELQTVTIAHLALVEFVLSDDESRPHLALVDINMPAIDGFGLAGEFIHTGLPTILMSTHVDPERRARGAAIGVLELLEKPHHADGYAAFTLRVLQLAGRDKPFILQ